MDEDEPDRRTRVAVDVLWCYFRVGIKGIYQDDIKSKFILVKLFLPIPNSYVLIFSSSWRRDAIFPFLLLLIQLLKFFISFHQPWNNYGGNFDDTRRTWNKWRTPEKRPCVE